jgi:hypothetical protein
MLSNVKNPNQFVLHVATGVYGSTEPSVTLRGNKTTEGWHVQVEREESAEPGASPPPAAEETLHLSGAWAEDITRTLAETRLHKPVRMPGARVIRLSLDAGAALQEPDNTVAWRETAAALAARARNRPTAPLRFVHVTPTGRTELRVEHDIRARRAWLIGRRDGKEVHSTALPLPTYKALKVRLEDLRMNREPRLAVEPAAPGVYLDVGDGVLRSWHNEVGGNFDAMQLRQQVSVLEEPTGFHWGTNATTE